MDGRGPVRGPLRAPHQLREAGTRLDASNALRFPAAGALPAVRKRRGWWLQRKLTEYSLWEVAGARSVAPALAPCPVLEGLVSSALGGDVTARPPLFCLHHFVDHRPKILTGFLP